MKDLPVFMYAAKTYEILKQAASAVPKGGKAYIVGGVVRNALYYRFFRKKLPQRDYDIVFIGSKERFIKNLRSQGFSYEHMRRKHEVSLKKKKVDKPKRLSDYVVLDIHFSKKSIIKNLKDHAGFTINGFALSLKDIASKNWYGKIISLPGALGDLKKRKLRVNVISHPADLFACIRFVSKGFKAPSKEEVKALLKNLGKLEKWRYERNVEKVFDYVGGEKKARKLVKKLGIKQDIFDFRIIKGLRDPPI